MTAPVWLIRAKGFGFEIGGVDAVSMKVPPERKMSDRSRSGAARDRQSGENAASDGAPGGHGMRAHEVANSVERLAAALPSVFQIEDKPWIAHCGGTKSRPGHSGGLAEGVNLGDQIFVRDFGFVGHGSEIRKFPNVTQALQ
ncbi:hypothetical protein JMK10_09610 [Rhodovulum sulfidophilum]|uniref:hypothetical protein n=1 Tax=Rhodovulum sulfidophilum TaxID=35806 RepID=UPI0019215915|nr:hypothetical protein [Rhodovulum sulfidophilum]MBL3572832.1 hypothetical protein [Rhodovulum sulfidophilum]MCE8433777.1 hypothetical protein [Rhodovulum sulfidophilum]MCF4117059.1 hypothetical protein [Rhodovulum sulfidophilum]